MSFIVKKIGVVSMTAAALLVASWGAQATDATPTAQVHVTASVVGDTCTPNYGSDTAAQVNLGKVSQATLVKAGDSIEKAFSIDMKNCEAGTVTVSVSDATDADGLFVNKGDAKGVGVALFGGENGMTQLFGTNKVAYTVPDGDTSLPFVAKVQRNNEDEIAVGSVDSLITLNLAFE